MSLFSLLWVPLFFLYRRGVSGSAAAAGGVWAFVLGIIAAVTQFLAGPLIDPEGFGFSRWISGCVDIVAFPALIPLLVYFLLIALKIISGTFDFANFALIWLIPVAAVRAVGWSVQNDPLFLVLVPLLWTAIAAGVPFFIKLILGGRKWIIALASLGILAVPFAAVSSWWMFFSQKTLWGFLLLLAAAAPALVSVILSSLRSQ